MHTALITGGASGIGYQLARLFARDGHHLVLVDMNDTKLREAKIALQHDFSQLKVDTLCCDLATSGAAELVYNHVMSLGISLSFLVNNAGFGVYGYFADTPWQKEERMLQLHVITLTTLTKLFLPGMIAAGFGRILNVSSAAAFQPGPLMAVYYASKSYVLSFSQAIANEVQGTGVSVTVLCPGVTPTGFQEAVGNGVSKVTPKSILSTQVANVALSGYKAMLQGKSLEVPGIINRTLLFMNRFVSRSFSIGIVRKAQERIRTKAYLGKVE